MAYEVSVSAAYAVLYSVLVFFTILAIGTANWLDFLPANITKFWKLSADEVINDNTTITVDYFLSARNSANSLTIALSFFASGMGAWVVYGTTEMGANPQLSWLGVFGYSLASALPAILICYLGPKVREYMEEHCSISTNNKAFSTSDFGKVRYGRLMQLIISSVSVFYMFIFIVAELTSISNVFSTIINQFGNTSFNNTVTISIGLFTIFYTTIAGLPASIVTDRFQAFIMILLVLILTIAVCSFKENRITKEEYAVASNWTVDGLMAAVTLFIAIACAELFNQSTWQRVWAAKDVKSMRYGFAYGSILVFFLMLFFGIMGIIAYANDPVSYDNGEKWFFLAFFDLLQPLDNFWHIILLILVTALAASSIDSLQNGITIVLAADIIKLGYNAKWITRVLLVLTNIPAIYMASRGHSVLSLFLVADLVCATSVLPVFLGLQINDYCNGLLVAPTELGAILGCISGVVTVLVNGAINKAGLFNYFWLNNGAMCALCGSKTMVSFIITPIMGGVMTYFFSFIDVKVRGERARKPIIAVPFDKDDDATIDNINAMKEEEEEKKKGEKEDEVEMEEGAVDA